MMLSPPRRLPWLILVTFLCAFSSVLNAYDLSQRRQPQGPLGVALDYSLATTYPNALGGPAQTPRNWMWSSHLQFAQPVSAITDAQLWQIAIDAFNEVPADMNQYQINARNRPNAMTVLAFGDEIILASSQKGQTSYTYSYENTPVLETLRLCQTVWRDNGPGGGATDNEHRTNGKCGEVMAAHLYYSIYTAALAQGHARIGTVVQSNGVLAQTDPCGDPQRDVWGCNLFVAGEGLTVLDVATTPAAYTLNTIAGGPVVRNQIQLCSVFRPSSN